MPTSLLLTLPPRIFRLSYGPAQALTLISFPSFRPFAGPGFFFATWWTQNSDITSIFASLSFSF